MEEDLKAAAREGNIDALYRIIATDPKTLDYINEFTFVDTPLHEAARAGQAHFAVEMMNLMPSFAKKLNPEGLSPLHLAVSRGRDETRRRTDATALALVKLETELVRVKGRERMTPLHHAVREGNLVLLAEFLCLCPDSINDFDNRFQTALHLAVKERNIQALEVLLGWLHIQNPQSFRDVLDFQDEDGNTALHIAVETRQTEIVRKLLRIGLLRMGNNKVNSNNSTPLDLAIQKGDRVIREILQKRCCLPAKSRWLPSTAETLPGFLTSKRGLTWGYLRKAFVFLKLDYLSLDMRNMILVVATLIVAATFQAVLQPPGELLQQHNDAESRANINVVDRRTAHRIFPHAGDSFFAGNTLAFVSSMAMIFLAVPGRFHLLVLYISLLCLTTSYLVAVETVAPPTYKYNYLTIFSYILIVMVYLGRFWVFAAKLLLRLFRYFPLPSMIPNQKAWLESLL